MTTITSKAKGDLYELYIKNYLKSENKTSNVFIWYEIPEELLVELKLIHCLNEHRILRKKIKKEPNPNPLQDVGIDILAKTSDDKYELIQCKNGYKNGITVKDLAGFFMMMTNHKKYNGKVYYTSKLSRNITENSIDPRISYIKKLITHHQEKKLLKVYSPFPYQEEALKALKKHFSTKSRGILAMPCGTGKTFISSEFAKDYDYIFFLVPLKQFAEQTINKYEEYHKNINTLLVDSDGTRDILEVKKFIKNAKGVTLLSSTYKSVDIINQALEFLQNKKTIIIIDEYHNLSKNNLVDETDEFYKLLNNQENKILFMSATPRVYVLENSEYEETIFDSIFGKIVYKMDFSKAIENKYITDYKIILPSVNEDKSNLIEEVDAELKLENVDLKTIDKNMETKVLFLLKGLAFHGNRKCIVYLRNCKEVITFIKTFNEINKHFYALDVYIDYIISSTKHSNRNLQEPIKNSREYKLNKFSSTNQIAILCSVEILDECIDIPSCDSIFISYPSKSKVRTIQRMSRCLRTSLENPEKEGYIYVWCEEYSEILGTLSGIKEYDPTFDTKIKTLQSGLKVRGTSKKELIQDTKELKEYVINLKEYRITVLEKKTEVLLQYIREKGELPPKELIYDGLPIGSLAHCIVSTMSKAVQNYKEGFVDDFKKRLGEINDGKVLEKVNKRIDKIKENRQKDKLEVSVKFERLLNILIEREKKGDINLLSVNCKEGGFNSGAFQKSVISYLSERTNGYKEYRKEWDEKFAKNIPKIWKLMNDRATEIKKNRKKELVPLEEKFNILEKFYKKNKRMLNNSDNIGEWSGTSFQDHIVSALAVGDRFHSEIGNWKLRLIKLEVWEEINKKIITRLESRAKEKFSPEQKVKLLIEIYEETGKLVASALIKVIRGVEIKLGSFQADLFGSFKKEISGDVEDKRKRFAKDRKRWMEDMKKLKIWPLIEERLAE